MFENSASARKKEILMRVAQGRLGALAAVEKAGSRASACVSSLAGLPRLVRYGSLAGAGVIGFVAARKLARLSRMLRAAKAAAPEKESGLLRYLVAQAATLVLLPWLRQRMLGGRFPGAALMRRPADAFFRWIGLGG